MADDASPPVGLGDAALTGLLPVRFGFGVVEGEGSEGTAMNRRAFNAVAADALVGRDDAGTDGEDADDATVVDLCCVTAASPATETLGRFV